MPLDFNRITATVTGTVSDCHTYVKSIETANFGKLYTKAFDGLNYYVVDSVAKPALQKVSELDYTKRAVDTILKHKNVSIVVGVGLLLLFLIWLHSSGKPSKIESEGELSKNPDEVEEVDEIEGEEEIDDDLEGDGVGWEEGGYTIPSNVGLIPFMESADEGDNGKNGIDVFDFLITPESSQTINENPTRSDDKKTLYLDEEGNRIDEEGRADLDDDDEYEYEWHSSTSTSNAKNG